MHEPGDKIIVRDIGLAVAPGLHTLFDLDYSVVSTNNSAFIMQLYRMSLWYC